MSQVLSIIACVFLGASLMRGPAYFIDPWARRVSGNMLGYALRTVVPWLAFMMLALFLSAKLADFAGLPLKWGFAGLVGGVAVVRVFDQIDSWRVRRRSSSAKD
jgi:hypothetical protein